MWTAAPSGIHGPTRRPVAGLAEELARGVDGRRGVVEAAHPRDEQANHLVPDELVDDRLSVDEYAGGHLVEAVEQVREVARRHPLGDACRAAHVSEQHRQLDLRTAVVRVDVLVAAAAVAGVLLPGPEPDHSHRRAARPGERAEAHLAARRPRQASPEAPLGPDSLVGPVELPAPVGLRHRRHSTSPSNSSRLSLRRALGHSGGSANRRSGRHKSRPPPTPETQSGAHRRCPSGQALRSEHLCGLIQAAHGVSGRPRRAPWVACDDRTSTRYAVPHRTSPGPIHAGIGPFLWRRRTGSEPMRVFVAGAAGAIGRQLVPMLIEAGHVVTGTTRSAERAVWLRSQGAQAVVLDVLDGDALRAAVVDARPQRRGPSADGPRGGFRRRTAPRERAPSPGRNAQPDGCDRGGRGFPDGRPERRVAVRARPRAARGARPAARPGRRPRSRGVARHRRTRAHRHLDARRRRIGVALRLPVRTGHGSHAIQGTTRPSKSSRPRTQPRERSTADRPGSTTSSTTAEPSATSALAGNWAGSPAEALERTCVADLDVRPASRLASAFRGHGPGDPDRG